MQSYINFRNVKNLRTIHFVGSQVLLIYSVLEEQQLEESFNFEVLSSSDSPTSSIFTLQQDALFSFTSSIFILQQSLFFFDFLKMLNMNRFTSFK